MAFEVTVVFATRIEDTIALLSAASSALAAAEQSVYVREMLEDFIQNPSSCVREHGKGLLFVYGGVFNHFSDTGWYDRHDYDPPLNEVAALKSLLADAYRRRAVLPHRRALLFANPEENDRTYVFEFRATHGADRDFYNIDDVDLTVRRTVIQMGWDRWGSGDFPGSEADD